MGACLYHPPRWSPEPRAVVNMECQNRCDRRVAYQQEESRQILWKEWTDTESSDAEVQDTVQLGLCAWYTWPERVDKLRSNTFSSFHLLTLSVLWYFLKERPLSFPPLCWGICIWLLCEYESIVSGCQARQSRVHSSSDEPGDPKWHSFLWYLFLEQAKVPTTTFSCG